MKNFDCRLYLVTDSNCLAGKDFFYSLEQALLGGVTLVQLREKHLATGDYYQLALRAKYLCDKYRVPLLINDRVDIALAVDAAGVHIGQSDLPLAVARKILGEKAVIGVTAHNVQEAVAAQEQGADYLGVGCIFPTVTKLDTTLIGLSGLQEICRATTIPVAGIGGIHANNAREVIRAGAHGIAVASGIMGEVDIMGTVGLFLFALQDALPQENHQAEDRLEK